MTTTVASAAMTTTSTRHRAGLALLAVIGLLDYVSLSALGDPDSPKPVIATNVALGVITLVGVLYATRGSRAGLWAAVIASLIAAVLGVPAYFLDAPALVLVTVTAVIVLTILATGLVAPNLRRAKAQLAGS
jgi:membrane-bound metal-dependent hydrolase YbcI (DUF457 family)